MLCTLAGRNERVGKKRKQLENRVCKRIRCGEVCLPVLQVGAGDLLWSDVVSSLVFLIPYIFSHFIWWADVFSGPGQGCFLSVSWSLSDKWHTGMVQDALLYMYYLVLANVMWPVSGADAAPGECTDVYGHWLQPACPLPAQHLLCSRRKVLLSATTTPTWTAICGSMSFPWLQAKLGKNNLKHLEWVPGEGWWWGCLPTLCGSGESLENTGDFS